MVDKIFNEDCIEGMKKIPDGSVDFVLTDLPFSITACDWDKKINLEKFWIEVKRIIKPQSSAAMFASGKFSYELVNSNYDWYKYKWIWIKNKPTCFIHAKNRPMSKYEEILIFSNGVVNHESLSPKTRMKYFPQGTAEIDKLAESNKKLADAVDKFFAKVTNIDVRVSSIEYELRNIGSRLDKIESLLLKGDK